MTGLYNDEPSIMQNFNLNWRTSWLSWFESPWGIIEKIKYANVMSSKDFMNLFGSEKINELKTTIGKENKNLITLRGISDNKLMKLLGFSLQQTNLQMIKKLTNPLFDGEHFSSSYFHSELMLCPYCIEGGYHSLFHQFKLIKKCPFHQEDLIKANELCVSNTCKAINYEITGDKKINPFGCSCGASWLGSVNHYSPTWYQPQKDKIKIDSIRKWITLKPNEIDVIRKIFYLKREEDPIISENLLDEILKVKKPMGKDKYDSFSVISSKYVDKLKIVYTSNINSIKNKNFFSSFSIHSNEVYQDHFDYIYESTRNVLKSISRMIRKKVYANHKNCLLRMKNSIREPPYSTEPYCPIAFSYLKWRKIIQGFDSINKVDNSFFYDTQIKHRIDIALNLDKEWLLEFISNFRYQIEFYSPHNIYGLTWLINHIISYVATNYFNYLLEYTVTYKEKHNFYNFNGQHYTRLDPILIKFPSKIGEPYEFHRYNSKGVIDIDKYNSFCIFQYPGKYRLKKQEKKIDPIKMSLEKIESKNYLTRSLWN